MAPKCERVIANSEEIVASSQFKMVKTNEWGSFQPGHCLANFKNINHTTLPQKLSVLNKIDSLVQPSRNNYGNITEFMKYSVIYKHNKNDHFACMASSELKNIFNALIDCKRLKRLKRLKSL